MNMNKLLLLAARLLLAAACAAAQSTQLDAPTTTTLVDDDTGSSVTPTVTQPDTTATVPGGDQSLGGSGSDDNPSSVLTQPTTSSAPGGGPDAQQQMLSPVFAPTASLLPAAVDAEACPAGLQFCANAGACKDTQSDADFCGPSCARCACGEQIIQTQVTAAGGGDQRMRGSLKRFCSPPLACCECRRARQHKLSESARRSRQPAPAPSAGARLGLQGWQLPAHLSCSGWDAAAVLRGSPRGLLHRILRDHL